MSTHSGWNMIRLNRLYDGAYVIPVDVVSGQNVSLEEVVARYNQLLVEQDAWALIASRPDPDSPRGELRGSFQGSSLSMILEGVPEDVVRELVDQGTVTWRTVTGDWKLTLHRDWTQGGQNVD